MNIKSLVILVLACLLGFACSPPDLVATQQQLAELATDEAAPPSCDDANAIKECDGQFSDDDCKGADPDDDCEALPNVAGKCRAVGCWLVGEKDGAAVCKCDCPCLATAADAEADATAE
jgi:hypothetical protein